MQLNKATIANGSTTGCCSASTVGVTGVRNPLTNLQLNLASEDWVAGAEVSLRLR
jgi:hypothetical protein